MLMGFSEKDFDKIKPFYEKNILTREALYKQAGNSIVVQAITSIFNVVEDIENMEKNNG
nr:hypothetical protein [Mycoplasmopsis cynos]